MKFKKTCAQVTCFRITCHKELMNFRITSVCDNISLRITSYSDEMNILKEYDKFQQNIYATKNTINTITYVYNSCSL
jgi:hypothetical protein